MIKGYILDRNNNPVEADMAEAAIWKDRNFERCIVNRTDLGHVEVSTVFTGLDLHSYGGGPPVVFETLTFGIQLDGIGCRCCTWAQALQQHEEVCEHIRKQVLAQ